MSMVAMALGNQGPSPEELAREGRVKNNLTSVLKSAVKELQKVYIGSDAPIRSTDNANAVCNVLEAVFLHGLKSWPSTKNFWAVLTKVTHRDVVSQLKQLGQISAEVGMCRAWLRLALNEGLMESYLESLAADQKILSQYYRSHAYLRDQEQRDIFKSYIQSLAYFTFELSYNSSVLNLWTSTPLMLAGFVKGQDFPQPVVQSKVQTSGTEESTQVPEPSASPSMSSSTDIQPQGRREASHSALTPDTPPNTPYTATELSRGDIEAIRKLTIGCSDTASTSTSVSQPDFTDARDHNVMPSVIQDLQELKFRAIMADSGPIQSAGAEAASKSQTINCSTNKNTPKMERKPSITDFLPKKSPPLQPEITNAVATICDQNVETATEALNQSPKESIAVLVPVRSIDTDSDSEKESQPAGNSLGIMRGWSSDFEPDILPDVSLSGEFTDPKQSAIPVDESFDSLLHNYNQVAGSLERPSLHDVLESLPASANSQPSSQESKPQQVQRPRKLLNSDTSVSSSLDYEPFEYEVLPDLVPGDKSYLSDPKYQPLLEIIGDLCNERGLDAQNYQCFTCSRPVGMFYGKARVCQYNGCYYCYECHENDAYYIPSRIIYNWDFSKHQVSRRNYEFLRLVEEEPLLNIQKLNPALYQHVPELVRILHLRMQLYFLKIYLFTCRQSIADDLRRQVWPKEYLFDDIHAYSLNDLLQISSGYLGDSIQKVIKFATKHVYSCNLCSMKGFICEICNKGKVIYPFQMETTTRCLVCKSVYHKECKTDLVACPKCERRRVRSLSASAAPVHTPDACDFALPSVQIAS